MQGLNVILVILQTSIEAEGTILTENRKFEVLAPALVGVNKEIYLNV